MNIQSSCQDMCAKLGFGCVQLEDEYPPMMALQTPFGFYGGDPFEIYAEYLGEGDPEQIRFFDSGGTLFHCFARQINSFHLRDYQVVKAAIKQPDIKVTHEGEIEGTFENCQHGVGVRELYRRIDESGQMGVRQRGY
ncbi:hypothetical protein ACMX25_10215 [Caballeronia sp. 15715]|uniref:hypothetical protein n=1 Tax=Caballeronia sp. 15715 TaxID=3391030 RepID=UPI0039E64CE6